MMMELGEELEEGLEEGLHADAECCGDVCQCEHLHRKQDRMSFNATNYRNGKF